MSGRSGTGKTTTLSVLLGFVTPHSGSVTVAGVPLDEIDMSRWREAVAWVPQSPAFTGGTVRAELGLTGASAAEVDAVLRRLDLDGLAERPVHRLSVGQRQRVAVARALLRVRQGAWLLLLDEPTAHLDAANAERVWQAVQEAQDAGAAVVVAAHPRREATPSEGNARSEAASEVGSGRTDRHVRPVPLRELGERRLIRGVVLGAAALLAGVALTATSAWLIAKASQQPPILTLTVAVVGVRTFGLARAGLRYVERLVTHDGAFRVAARLRERLWRAMVRLGPARVLGASRDEGLRRLVDDVAPCGTCCRGRDTAARPRRGGCVVQTVVLPRAGWVLVGASVVAALVAPTLAVLLDRHATATLAEGRRDVAARVLSLFDGAAELLAFGAHARHRARLADSDARLAAVARRQAWGEGAAEAVVIVATGLAAVAGVVFAADAVGAGTLDPVLAPVPALVPLALAEALSLLPPAAQHWDALRRARTRLAATLDVESVPDRPEGAVELTPGGGVRLRAVDVRWPGGARPTLRDVDLDIPEGRTSPSSDRRGRASRRCWRRCWGSCVPSGAAPWCPSGWRGRRRNRNWCPRPSPRTCGWPTPTPTSRDWSGRCAPRGSPNSTSTPCWATPAAGCPGARPTGWRWRGRCSPRRTPTWCCSTSPRRTWTSRPPARSWPTCGRRWRVGQWST